MWKRLFFIITLLLITGMTAGWYFFAKESRYLGTSPLRAVPVESPFFVRIRNLGDFAEKTVKNSCWQAMGNFSEISVLYKDLVLIDSLIHQNKECESFLRHKELFVVPTDSSKLFLLDIGSITEKNSINSFLRNYFLSKNSIVTTPKFKDASLQQYEWIEKSVKWRILVAYYRGVLMVGNDLSHLRKAIDQMDQHSVLDDADYLRINKNTTENVDLNIFVNHKMFPSYLSGFCSDSTANGILQPNYAKWTELDVMQKERRLFVNGYTVSDTTSASFLNIYKRQKPLSGSLPRWMPVTTTFFLAQCLSSPVQYFEDYTGYLRKNGQIVNYNNQVATVSNELNLNISQYFKKSWTGEAAIVFTNLNLDDKSDNRFLLMKVRSNPNDSLFSSIKKWSLGNKNRQQDIEASDAAKNNIWKVPCEYFGKIIGELYFGSVKTNWMTAGDGFILMGSTPGSLRRYLTLLKTGELLQGNSSYAKFTSGLAQSYNFYMWCTPGQSLPFFEPVFSPRLYKKLNESIHNLKKLENFAWQWGSENGMVYNTASLIVNPIFDQNQLPYWKYPLKAKMRNKPVFVSYSDKNMAKELVFQDIGNNLISLDKEGLERLKIHLEGVIMGGIKMIDFKRNGEYQLLFNTKEAIHLIDRNGMEIKNFPVWLKSSATNEMAVFDYDGKKDYRYLIACADHKVYSLDKNGKKIAGWAPKSTEGVVDFPVHHFRVESRDYIVFFDRKHTYILDRQGKVRVRIKDEFVHSENDISLIRIKGNHENMVTSDEHGNIRLFGFDGLTRSIHTGNYSSTHFFLPVDLTGEGHIDFLFFDKQNLVRYDFSGEPIFSHTVDASIDQSPSIFNIGDEKVIELSSMAENKTILIKKDGSIFNIFLPGKFSLLTIGSFNANGDVVNLLVATSDGFLSNYQMIKKMERP